MGVEIALAAGGAAALGGGVASYFGAKEQADAAKKASELQAAEAAKARDAASVTGGVNAQGIGAATDLAGQYAQAYGAQGIGELQQGRDMALGQITGYGAQAEQSLGQGYENAINAFQSGTADSAVNRLQADPNGYMASDPGYNFRLAQGEQGINRDAAARGGRYSGRTMMALDDYRQGMASSEYGNAFGRAQAQDTANRATAGGIADLYGAQGQGMGGFYQGQGSQLGDVFMQSGNALYGANQSLGNQFGNITMQGAQGQANALQGSTQQGTALAQSMIPQYNNAVDYAGGGAGAIGQTMSNLSSLALAYGASQGGGGDGFGQDWADTGNAYYR
jgi:hypothetical protein